MKVTFLGNHEVDYSSEAHHSKSLEALGHQVIRLQEGKAGGEQVLDEALQSDLLVIVHTHGWATPGLPLDQVLSRLREARIPSLSFHLDLWFGLQRQQDLDADPFYRNIDHFFTVDRLMADWFNQNTPVRGHYLPAAVFGPECYPGQPVHLFGNDVIFVGQRNYHPEWPYRPQLIDWLETTYGDRFTRIAGDTPAGTTRGDDLNRLYASSKVVVGDSLCLGFDYPDYVSDRPFETLGRGGFLIMPTIKGVDRYFTDGEHLVNYTFGDFDQLKFLIDYYIEANEEREQIRKSGHEHVKANHTYARRWETILNTVFA